MKICTLLLSAADSGRYLDTYPVLYPCKATSFNLKTALSADQFLQVTEQKDICKIEIRLRRC